jgi:chromosome segregation ATPase
MEGKYSISWRAKNREHCYATADELQPLESKQSRKQLRATIAEKDEKIHKISMSFLDDTSRIAELEKTISETHESMDMLITGNGTLQRRNAELEQQLVKNQNIIIEKDQLITKAMAIIKPLMEESEELQQQIENLESCNDLLQKSVDEAQESVRIVDALNKMPRMFKLVRGYPPNEWWLNDADNHNLTRIHKTIAETLTAAGLLEGEADGK